MQALATVVRPAIALRSDNVRQPSRASLRLTRFTVSALGRQQQGAAPASSVVQEQQGVTQQPAAQQQRLEQARPMAATPTLAALLALWAAAPTLAALLALWAAAELPAAASELSGGPPASSYYVSLGLFLMSVPGGCPEGAKGACGCWAGRSCAAPPPPAGLRRARLLPRASCISYSVSKPINAGLWSLIKRSPKAKIKRKTFEVAGPGAAVSRANRGTCRAAVGAGCRCWTGGYAQLHGPDVLARVRASRGWACLQGCGTSAASAAGQGCAHRAPSGNSSPPAC